jgi:predicted secreted hydrolase
MLQSGILTSPDDEGRHMDAETEWWYFNGHVEAEDGKRYAFMVSYTIKIDLKYGDNWWKQLGKPFTYEMHNQYGKMRLDLHLASLKPPLILGEERQGKMPMGKGGYTYWYALSHLNIQGELKWG